jgi:hypothetical protein
VDEYDGRITHYATIASVSASEQKLDPVAPDRQVWFVHNP